MSKSPGRQIIRAVSLTALLVTFVSLFSIGRVARRLEISGLFSGPAELGQQILAQYRVLVATPPSSDWIAPGTGGRDIVRYVRDCTQPTDRVFVTGFHPELFFFSGRGFAGDRAFVLPGFWTQRGEQQRTVETMKRQSVPLAIVDATGGDDIGFARGLPLIQEHISASYHQVGTFGFGASSGVLYNVWAEKARPPVNTYQPLGLPCYR